MGGLWCLPSLELDESALEFIHDNYALQGSDCQQLTRFKHRFSHFHLTIHAVAIKTKPLTTQVKEPLGIWVEKKN